MGWFEEIVYKWWMSITQAHSSKNWTRNGEINVWPSVMEQSGQSNFIIWVIIHYASTRGLIRSCFHNALCVWACASDKREPHSPTC